MQGTGERSLETVVMGQEGKYLPRNSKTFGGDGISLHCVGWGYICFKLLKLHLFVCFVWGCTQVTVHMLRGEANS